MPLDSFCINRRQKSGLNSSCKDCQKIANASYDHKAWRDANRESLNARNKEWRDKNPEKCTLYRQSIAGSHREYHAVWRVENKEKAKALRERWAANNRPRVRLLSMLHKQRHQHKYNAKEAERRSGKLMATPGWANQFVIGEVYHLACVRTKATGFEWEVDHIVPLKSPIVCGLHVESNLAVIPAAINRSKSNRYWPDMP